MGWETMAVMTVVWTVLGLQKYYLWAYDDMPSLDMYRIC